MTPEMETLKKFGKDTAATTEFPTEANSEINTVQQTPTNAQILVNNMKKIDLFTFNIAGTNRIYDGASPYMSNGWNQ